MNNNNPISLKIIIYSYDLTLLINAIDLLNNLATLYKIQCTSMFKAPRNIKKITVNRSPHIDKKSREQFKMVNCRYIITWEITEQKKLMDIIHALKHKISPKLYGVSLKMNFHFNTQL